MIYSHKVFYFDLDTKMNKQMKKYVTSGLLLIHTLTNLSAQEKIVLYENDFETPNLKFVVNCNSNFVSQQNINTMYKGTASARSLYKDAVFNQMNTAEILYHDPLETVYKDPQNKAGKYSLSINYSFDRLSLTFKRSDMQTLDYFNVQFDMTAALPLSSTSSSTCGVATPTNIHEINVKVYQHNDSTFNALKPPTNHFAHKVLVGAPMGERRLASTNSYLTYNWKRMAAPFDISGVTQSYITVTFDLKEPGYVALDNFYIDANIEALPLVLNYFKLIHTAHSPSLEWNVAAIENFSHFEVEASKDGKDWHYLQHMAYNDTVATYTTPTRPEYGQYRLRIVDLDQTYTYSKIVYTNQQQKDALKVFPNPAQNRLHVSTPKQGTMTFTNLQGQIVYEAQKQDYTQSIDVANWPKGIYWIKLLTDEKVAVEKVVIQ